MQCKNDWALKDKSFADFPFLISFHIGRQEFIWSALHRNLFSPRCTGKNAHNKRPKVEESKPNANKSDG